MRASGHDFTSSLAEAIDNSIGHGDADEVRIKLSWLDQHDKRRTPRLKEVHIADNGIGMDKETLARCLVLGFSSTYNDRRGIGRFGFGMTAGALGQCRRIEVYSKTKDDSDYRFVFLDLDAFLKGSTKLSHPTKKAIPEEYRVFLKRHGTLVIWHFLDIAAPFNDKPLEESDSDLRELHYDIGRIYRKFIGEEIIENEKQVRNPRVRRIFINSVRVKPFDPLYFTKIPGLEEEPRAEMQLEDTSIELPPHPSDTLNTDQEKKVKVTIRMTLLPKEWRPTDQSERNELAERRYIDRNEGVSILRNSREVYYGRIQGLGPAEDVRDRWWGLEIVFNPELDYWFSIKNVKQGAVPIRELKEKINKVINSQIRICREIVSSGWNNTYTKDRKADAERTGADEHRQAEKRFKETGIGTPKAEEGLSSEEKEKRYKDLEERFAKADAIFDRDSYEQLKIKFLNDYNMNQKSPFIDIIPKGNATTLVYNIQHVFFERIYQILVKIEKAQQSTNDSDAKNDLTGLIGQLRYCIDLLLGSYAAAHASLDPYAKQEVRTTLLSLLSRWNESLQIVTDDSSFLKKTNE